MGAPFTDSVYYVQLQHRYDGMEKLRLDQTCFHFRYTGGGKKMVMKVKMGKTKGVWSSVSDDASD
jgi:hypothetical protein